MTQRDNDAWSGVDVSPHLIARHNSTLNRILGRGRGSAQRVEEQWLRDSARYIAQVRGLLDCVFLHGRTYSS